MSALRCVRAGRLLSITVARPDRLNAVDVPAMQELADAFTAAATDPEVRAIVLTGEGRAFCSGFDLAGPRVDDRVVMETANAMIRAIVACPKPVVAKVNGLAAGIGASMVLACDFSYLAEKAYLLLAFVNIGLMPDGGSTALVAAAVGRARAMELALLGERLYAPEALAAGLITGVPADLDAWVAEVAGRLAAGPQQALALTKRAVNLATLTELDAELDVDVLLVRGSEMCLQVV